MYLCIRRLAHPISDIVIQVRHHKLWEIGEGPQSPLGPRQHVLRLVDVGIREMAANIRSLGC